MIKRFIHYYKPYRLLLTLDIIASMLISITGMVYPIISRNMLNDYIPNLKLNLIIQFGILLLIIYLIRACLRYFVHYYGHVMGTYIQVDMRNDLFKKIEKLPFKFFDNQETGKIMSRITTDLFEVSELAHHGPENLLISSEMLILSFIYLLSINVSLTLIIYSSVPILLFISIKLRKKMKEASLESKITSAKISGDIASSISGIRVTKAFTNEKLELHKFSDLNKEYISARKKHFKAFSLFLSSSSLITDLFNVICLISGGIFLYKGSITFADYSTFIISINLFINPINTLVNFTEQLDQGLAGLQRFYEIMDEKEEIDNPKAKSYSILNGDIEFKNVTFKYIDSEKKEVLNNISFKVEKGKTIALVGPSGGGKTTICHLLPRFYETHKGKITIDSKNINNITKESLRNNIGIVQQDVFLFSGTFYDNILYGNLNATKEEVIEASKKANIYDYIMSLPNGFDTEIGERGVKLSGGQKQRLSIARVFLKNPSILILDEATSALDNTTEILIQKALDSLKEGRTTIVVAHRLSTIKNADKILVVSNGNIVEKGNHQELMKIKNGIYKKLYKSQFIDQNIMMS